MKTDVRCNVCKRQVEDGERIITLSRAMKSRRGGFIRYGNSDQSEFICLACIKRAVLAESKKE